MIDPEQRAALLARSPLQRRRDRPAAGPAGGDPYAHAAATLRALARRRRRRRRRRARAVGARAGLHRPGRRAPHAPRVLRARARRGVRPRPDPPARAHAPRPEGGPAAADARDAREPLADLLALRRRRPGRRSRRTSTGAPFGELTDDDGTRHRLWRVADPDAIAAVAGGARARRAADRRRPPPLRDRARVRGGDRRRGRAPLRADVPRRAPGPGAHGLPHPPPADRPRRRARATRCATRSSATGTSRRSRDDELEPAAGRPRPDRLPRRPPRAPAAAHAQGPGDRRRRAARQAAPPTAGSTPPCIEALLLAGRARDERGRHLAPARARLRALDRRGARPRPLRRRAGRPLHGRRAGRARARGRGGRRGDAAEVDVLLPQGPDRPAVQPARRATCDSMARCAPSPSSSRTSATTSGSARTRSRPTSRRTTAATTPARARRSCWPRRSPSCTAITMEMYAKRKGWDVAGLTRRLRVHARPSAAARRASRSS